MNEDRIPFFSESFNDIKEDMGQALNEEDIDTIHYNFLRVYRLLERLDQYLFKTIQNQQSWKVAKNVFLLRNDIQDTTSNWNSNLAHFYAKKGDPISVDREWLSTLSQAPTDFNHYIQYAHATIEKSHLFVNKDIKENIQFVNRHNVHEIKKCIRRARFSLKIAKSINGHITEPIQYFLTWLELLEKEVTSRTDLVEALNVKEEQITVEVALTELNELIGLDTVKQRINEISNWVVYSELRRESGFKVADMSLHMVFSGNPGTGKTTVARIVAKIFKALGVLEKGHLVEASRQDLVAEYVGQTATKTMKVIREAEGGVLFIDEAYSLTRFSGSNDFGIEAVDTIVKQMEDNRKNLVVILAGYPNEMNTFIQSNPGLVSRFKYHIDFPDYTIPELLQINDLLLQQKQYRMTSEAKAIMQQLIEKLVAVNPTSHGNGRLVRNIIEDAILNKAACVVEKKQESQDYGELDLLDETIMRMVKISKKTKKERFEQLKGAFKT